MSGCEKQIQLSVTQWEDFWKKDYIGWHESSVNEFLTEFYDHLNTNPPGRIFLPLCGKTLDMVWLADKGHEVVGLEFSEIGIKDFFKENNLEFTKKGGDNFVIYKATTKNITIFQGDFFCATTKILGVFENIWDRGSYVAIDIQTRDKYASIVSTLLKEDGRYLLETVFYDETKYPGPPHNVSDESMKNTLGKYFTYEQLKKITHGSKNPFKLEWLEQNLFVLHKK